jgi:tellurite resistance protein TerC
MILGNTVLLAGLAMVVLPGPALVVIPLSPAILEVDFPRARTVTQRVRIWFDKENRSLPHSYKPR